MHRHGVHRDRRNCPASWVHDNTQQDHHRRRRKVLFGRMLVRLGRPFPAFALLCRWIVRRSGNQQKRINEKCARKCYHYYVLPQQKCTFAYILFALGRLAVSNIAFGCVSALCAATGVGYCYSELGAGSSKKTQINNSAASQICGGSYRVLQEGTDCQGCAHTAFLFT